MSDILDSWDSSFMCGQFAEYGITKHTMWDTSKNDLLRMKIPEDDQIRLLDS